MAMKIEDHLERIRSDTDNPAPYLVLADWLQERKDPWGKLIVLQHELEKRPGDGAIAAEIDGLLKKHGWAPKVKPRILRLDWRWGFIRAIRVYDEYERVKLDELLGPILDLGPMAALVQSCLIFRNPRFVDEDRVDAILSQFPEGVVEQVAPVDLEQEKEEKKQKPDPQARWINAPAGSKVPKETTRFKRLTVLGCRGVSSLPKELGTLPLERLNIDFARLQAIPDEIWGIESLGFISMYRCDDLPLNMAQANNLLLGFLRARTPRAQRVFEAALLQGKRPPGASIEQLLSALDNNVKTVRIAALDLLREQLSDPLVERPITKGSVVALLGSVNVDRRVLKERIEGTGAKLTTKVTKTTTHALLGEKPKGKQRELGSLPIVLETHLLSFADASGGSGVDHLSPEQVSAALRSGDDEKICGAVDALQQRGAVPKALLPELLVVTQHTGLEKRGRNLAKKLFAAFAPPKLKAAVAKHMKTSVLRAGETKQATRLTALEREAGSEIDMRRLARLLVEDFGCGFKFTLARGDADEIRWALQQRIDGRCINLRGLELASLPDLSAFDLVEVEASGNHLAAFPVELSALPSLTVLRLRANNLRTLPRDLAQFSTLETLDLAYNRFRVFPKGVITLPALRELDLRSDTWGASRITKIPKDIVNMKTLEVLKIENGHVEVEVPPEMAAMTWLKHLNLTWKGQSSKPPAYLRELLPDCKLT